MDTEEKMSHLRSCNNLTYWNISKLSEVVTMSFGNLHAEEETDRKGNFNAVFVSLASYGDYDNSCMVERANYKSFCEQPEVITVYGGYGSNGILVPVETMSEETLEMIEALEEYIIIDDELMYQMEEESFKESWEDTYKEDIMNSLSKLVLPVGNDDFQAETIIDDYLTEHGYDKIRNSGNVDFQVESGGSIWLDEREVTKELSGEMLAEMGLEPVPGVFRLIPTCYYHRKTAVQMYKLAS